MTAAAAPSLSSADAFPFFLGGMFESEMGVQICDKKVRLDKIVVLITGDCAYVDVGDGEVDEVNTGGMQRLLTQACCYLGGLKAKFFQVV